ASPTYRRTKRYSSPLVAAIRAEKARRSPCAARISSVSSSAATPGLPGLLRQGAGDFPVEDASLFRRQHRSHLEHMGDGRFLQRAHGVVEVIDRGAHLGAVALAGGDGLGQFAVGGANVCLQSLAPNGEA